MDWMLFIKGLTLGVCIAAPVGPIGILCIKTTLYSGFRAGVMCGMGAAVADMIYGSVAAFGISTIMTFLLHYKLFLNVLGSGFLLYLAWKIFSAIPQEHDEITTINKSLYYIFITTFLLTLANPMTILSFMGIFTGAGLDVDTSAKWGAIILVIGIFFGSLLWWLILSSIVSGGRKKLDAGYMRRINYISGAVLTGFAVYNLRLCLL